MGKRTLGILLTTALLAALAFAGLRRLDDAPARGAEAGRPPGTDITIVDFGQSGFTAPDGTGVRLIAGTAAVGASTWHLIGEPAYADIDGDRNLDAAVVVHERTADGTFPYILVWRWTPDGPVPAQSRIANGLCRVDGVLGLADPAGFQITGAATSPLADRAGCGGAVAETYVLAMRDGHLTQVLPAPGAAERCHPAPGEDTVTVTVEVAARVAPHKDAPVVAYPAELTSVELLQSGDGPDGWGLARIVGREGVAACGWISGADLID